ncbi:OmpH family outer membrane protein [Daejeonella sp. H1SJ63]|jgi:outer membrane protein|uniref:OmpH family outer membrane protein n=1 Tax=Daejeonella sp. H1SJ63 TaxID=3034145 RepID=UPI0023EC26EB|nr:OmpH family outer membrane protein [Daejeonella sp. H1SJ63]
MKNLLRIGVLAVGLFLAVDSANAQQKFGHINSADLLQAMPEMKTADANFQTFAKAKQTSLELMDAERQKQMKSYEEKYKTLSEANRAVLEKELTTIGASIQDLEKRITDAQEKAQEELTAKRSELYQPVFKKAEEAVKAVAKEKGFAYVFDVSQPGVVYFDGGEDLITAVKTKLGIAAAAK